MEFFTLAGKMSVGSRLRILSERLMEDAAKVYEMYQIEMKPKWFPVYYVLSNGEEKTITAIADEIGHSHPSVSKIIKEMRQEGWIQDQIKQEDKRKNVVTLTEKALAIVPQLNSLYDDVQSAVEEVDKESSHDLWKAVAEWEEALQNRAFFYRVREQRRNRELGNVQIIPYSSQYRHDFKRLNEEWISKYFEMEESDYKALDHPQTYILDKGGYILLALYKNEPVGTCALIKMESEQYDYELAKMAVSPKVQGLGIGYLLGQAVIDEARLKGAHKIYLESNSMLTPALNLYKKLGFTDVEGVYSPYSRCNVQMELALN